MRKLIEKISGLVKSTLSGFDRIVFKGFILPLMSAGEVMRFCRAQGVLNKDYKSWRWPTDQEDNRQCGSILQQSVYPGRKSFSPENLLLIRQTDAPV